MMKIIRWIKKSKVKLILFTCAVLGMYFLQWILFHYCGNHLSISICIPAAYILGNAVAQLDDYFQFKDVNVFLKEIKRRMENEVQNS